ncbi:MAG: hypothetical protein QOF55_2281 [Thermoleophilaceae bacterium]|jgi:hypothetical protein|nr:hypothetical protein [Thermoleophilaceae bacterium]
MDALTTTQGIVALAAAGVGLVALVLAMVLAFKLRRLRGAQKAVLGGNGQRDLVVHAQQLEQGFTDLRDWVEESIEHFERRMQSTENRLDGCVAYRSIVRYDAYNELSGHQSSSLALLDARKSGVVVSSIVHRDQARLYVKQLHDGEAEIELSPEEREAVDTALAPVRA